MRVVAEGEGFLAGYAACGVELAGGLGEFVGAVAVVNGAGALACA